MKATMITFTISLLVHIMSPLTNSYLAIYFFLFIFESIQQPTPHVIAAQRWNSQYRIHQVAEQFGIPTGEAVVIDPQKSEVTIRITRIIVNWTI
jgi:hypothetical protein